MFFLIWQICTVQKVHFGYDKGLTAGKSWGDEVEDIIEDSRCVGVVFYLSESCAQRPADLRRSGMDSDVPDGSCAFLTL